MRLPGLACSAHPAQTGASCGQSPACAIRGLSVSRVVRDELCQLIDAHDAEKFVDKRVVAAQGDGFAAAQALHQHADELADAAVVDAGDLGQVDQHVVVGGGIAAKLLQGAVVAGRDFTGEPQRIVAGLGRRGLHHFGGLNLAPGRRRDFKAHGVVHRQVFEVFLLPERLVKLQQQQPMYGAAVGGAVEVLQQCNQAVDAADLQLALGFACGGEDLGAFVCT